MADKSKAKWAVAGSWAVTFFVMQRIYAEALKGTKRQEELIGDADLVRPANEKILIPMVCMQAFAIEQLLKSILLRGGVEPPGTHDLAKLFGQMSQCTEWPGVQKACQREYFAWREQALSLAREEGGMELKIEPRLDQVLVRHRRDFETYRYPEQPKLGSEKPADPIRERMDMFLALCALEATRFQKICEDDYEGEQYALSGTQGQVRNVLTNRAKNLLRAFLADGGQNLTPLRNYPW